MTYRSTAVMNSLAITDSCRFCLRNVQSNHRCRLFNILGRKENLPSHLSKLLLLPVEEDGLSEYICRACKNNAIRPENRLESMQRMAKLSGAIKDTGLHSPVGRVRMCVVHASKQRTLVVVLVSHHSPHSVVLNQRGFMRCQTTALQNIH